MKYRIINADTRKLVGLAHSEEEANRRVGELNRRERSTCKFAWQSFERGALDVFDASADHTVH